MAIQKRLYTVDDVWELQCQPGNHDQHYELINGELVEMTPASFLHFSLAGRITHYLSAFVIDADAGIVGVEGGFYPMDDRSTLLVPDVAFVSKDRLPKPIPATFAGFMPNLAVEIKSPSNTVTELHRKAAIYLNNGTQLVWIIKPDQNGVDVCRRADDDLIAVEFVGIEGKLFGDDVLPGFELELRLLFPSAQS